MLTTTFAGPSRPHDALTLSEVPTSRGETGPLDGDVAIAAITSCTNTSNPRSLVAAGLLARNAVAAGLRSAPWTKTSLTPGSRAAADLLASAGYSVRFEEGGPAARFPPIDVGRFTGEFRVPPEDPRAHMSRVLRELQARGAAR